MALKKPSQQASKVRKPVSAEAADALADRLADKPYGAEEKQVVATPVPIQEVMTRTTISLPESLLIAIEDLARDNKRNCGGPKTVSAIIRDALSSYLGNN